MPSLLTTCLLLCLALQPSQSQFNTGQGFWNGFWNHGWDHQWNYRPYQPQQNCPQQFTDCMYKGDLALRLPARVNNGQTLTMNLDLILNYDVNRDNCITGQEFIGVTTARGFSVEYARTQFNTKLLSGVGVNNGACPGGISVAALKTLPQPAVVDGVAINNNIIQAMVTFCDQNTLRYQQNCDCIQLPAVCNKAPFQTTQACITFRTRYASYNNVCPFSYGPVISAKAVCASGNYGANPQLSPIIRLLCNSLNQKTPNVVG